MKVISVILARGGSKEVPKKNIKDLGGRPLISYAINASLNSACSETWVSTDCPEIKKVSENFGANVLDRPSFLATDFSQSDESLIHFVQNVSCDILVFLQPTSPFVTGEYINKGLDMMRGYDSIFSAYKTHWLPEWKNNDGKLTPINWDTRSRPMRQEVGDIFVENGAIYITTCHRLVKSGLRYSGAIGVLEMKKEDSYQIDSEDDFKKAEIEMKRRFFNNN